MEALSWSSLLTDTYGTLWKMIIRPPRAQYSVSELGPSKFRLGTSAFERKDLQLINDRGQRLECSHFCPLVAAGAPLPCQPCVVYLHGNCSCRLEAVDTLPLLLPRGMTVFAVDLSGSGLSEGEYISLGYYEEQDVRVVVQYLRSLGWVSSVALWGRSMGAATSILRAASDPELAACILDSPFSDLSKVAEDLVNNGIVTVPEFLVKMALQMVNKEVKTRAEFDIGELAPIRRAPQARSPVVFAVAEDDDFVLPYHSRRLWNAWGGVDRELVTFQGGHNGARPEWFMERAAEFLLSKFMETSGSSGARLSGLGLHQPANPAQAALEESESEDAPLVPPPPPEGQAAALPPAGEGSAGPADGSKPSLVPRPARNAALVVPSSPEALVAQKLVMMGFSEDMASLAARKNPNVEAAIEWISTQSVHILQESAKSLERMDLRAPPRSSVIGSGPPDQAANSLVTQLTDLGFSSSQAGEAARRCSSVEAAVEWLLTQR